jgi:hypothetical protein
LQAVSLRKGGHALMENVIAILGLIVGILQLIHQIVGNRKQKK